MISKLEELQYIILIFTLILSSCSTTAPLPKDQISEKSVDLSPIKKLKDGFLLVRLRSIEKQMEMLRFKRQRSAAYQLRTETKKKNAQIVKAFSNSFSFAPVYFFYSKYSRQIRMNSLDSIVLDDELLPVNYDLIKDKTFLVAEFAEIQPPADGAGLPALILRDEQLNQLKKPFPFYVRTSILTGESMEKSAVEQLQLNLENYLIESQD